MSDYSYQDVAQSLEHDVTEFWTLLLEIVAEAEKRLASQMVMHDLTPPQFFVLRTLDQHDGRCAIGQIAYEHHLTSATMTGLIKRLEAMQPPLVTREQSLSDRRSVDVVLTGAGKERFAAVQEDLMAQLRVVLSLLSHDERREVLEKITQYVGLILRTFPVNVLQAK